MHKMCTNNHKLLYSCEECISSVAPPCALPTYRSVQRSTTEQTSIPHCRTPRPAKTGVCGSTKHVAPSTPQVGQSVKTCACCDSATLADCIGAAVWGAGAVGQQTGNGAAPQLRLHPVPAAYHTLQQQLQLALFAQDLLDTMLSASCTKPSPAAGHSTAQHTAAHTSNPCTMACGLHIQHVNIELWLRGPPHVHPRWIA
jgi:hypothetical protein